MKDAEKIYGAAEGAQPSVSPEAIGRVDAADYPGLVLAERVKDLPRNHQQADQESKALGLTPESTKTIQTLVHRGIFWGGHVLLILFLLVLGSRVLHMILPDQWHWLNSANLKEIDQIILGLVAGLGARFFPNGSNGKRGD